MKKGACETIPVVHPASSGRCRAGGVPSRGPRPDHPADPQAHLHRPDPALRWGGPREDDRRIRSFRHPYPGGYEPPILGSPTANGILRMDDSTDVKWARPDLNRRPSGYQPARQGICRWEGQYPIWDPDNPPSDALDRSFTWLVESAYSEVARSSIENDLDQLG